MRLVPKCKGQPEPLDHRQLCVEVIRTGQHPTTPPSLWGQVSRDGDSNQRQRREIPQTYDKECYDYSRIFYA